MNKGILFGVSTVCFGILAGCGPGTDVDSAHAHPEHSGETPITFFKGGSTTKVKLVLHPDPVVMRSLPNVTPPKRHVDVYLPRYPESISTRPVSGIGDMGTPLDGDLVDGTAYFKSKDSRSQIKSWYLQQFQKLGYTITGQGNVGQYGETTSTYFAFTRNALPGDQTKYPEINLGFLSQNGETIFKLNALYIVVPPRPQNSYLQADIVKVVITKGKATKTITDKKWIEDVVRKTNALSMSTPSITSGGIAVAGSPTMIQADFYEKNNSEITVTYSNDTATVIIGNNRVGLNSGASPGLNKDFQSVFGNDRER